MMIAWASLRRRTSVSRIPLNSKVSASISPRWLSTDSQPPETSPGDFSAGNLSPAQMAKALLAGNCRAQLTSVVPHPNSAEPADVTSSVVHYLAPRGTSPVVLLSEQHHRQHLINLIDFGQASLCTGHLNPPSLVQRIRAAGWLPHRVNAVGFLERVPAAEVKFMWDQARAQYSAVSLGDMIPSEQQLDGLVGFKMGEVRRCQFVDATGKQHEVDPLEVDAAFLDPLAVGQHDLLLDFIDDPERRQQLRAFCAGYLGVEVEDAVVTEADRLGFTVLGKPKAPTAAEESDPKHPRWRQFRFGFQREMRNKEEFVKMVDDMWQEVQQVSAQHK